MIIYLTALAHLYVISPCFLQKCNAWKMVSIVMEMSMNLSKEIEKSIFLSISSYIYTPFMLVKEVILDNDTVSKA
jgi:hypothetical protein